MELHAGNIVSGKTVKIHFLNVGKGNCTIIEHPIERLSMIDIDNSRINDDERTLTDPVPFFRSKYEDRSLWRFILSHPDMDHMSGLDDLASSVQIDNFWDTKNNKEIEDWEGSPYNPDDWERYKSLRASEESPRVLNNLRGEKATCCWVEDGITILSPSKGLIETANSTSEFNHLCYVLLVEYAGTRILLGGDASEEAWDEIYEECGAEFLKADIFLAPHHGSKNNIHEVAFEAVAPDYVIVSVAEGIEYDYDYYHELANKQVLSTKHYGTISITIEDDGTYLPITVERNA